MTSGTQPVWNKEVTVVDSLVVGTSDSAKKEAFLQFSDISKKFIDSYSHLEQHIDRLSNELAAQTAEKEQQFEERNRLAIRLEKILSTLPSGVVVIDGHGLVQEFNSLAEDMLGLPLVGVTWLNIISRAFSPRSDDGLEISLKDGRRVKVETKALGSEPGQIVLLTDLTETRKLQEHQSREQRLSVIGKMMASLAHQIRTPLSSALLYSGHISSQKLDQERQQRFHMNLQHSLKQLERQVSDMLLFASGGVSSKQRFELNELTDGLALDIGSNSATKDVDVTIDNQFSEELNSNITLFGNAQALQGAIANLIENSLYACRNNKDKGKLTDISVCLKFHDQKNIIITILDNGCGIAENNKQQVFQPFFTSRPRGTGLGLAVVKTVINSFKGNVEIESKVGAGTAIKLIIPCLVIDTLDSLSAENSSINQSQTVSENIQQLAGGQ